MKDYVYLSEAKINNLYEQLQCTKQSKRETTHTWNAKIYSGSTKKITESNVSTFQKLEAVTTELESKKRVGPVCLAGYPYLKGEFDFQWGIMESVEGEKAVYFTVETDDFALLLGGSAGHVCGLGNNDFKFGGSVTPYFFNLIKNSAEYIEFLKTYSEIEAQAEAELTTSMYHEIEGIKWTFFGERKKFISQKLEFIARRSIHEQIFPEKFATDFDNYENTSERKPFVYATPLYVAYA